NPMAVDKQGVANLVAAAQAAGVERMLLISSIGATRPEHPLNRFGRVLDAKLAGEETLRASKLMYTIIRPGGLIDESGGQPLRLDQGDTISGRISRADVARVAVAALLSSAAIGKTFEAIADPSGTDDLVAAFARLD
ncbi:MAG TPA: NAD(P)H-binding protein, partial [Roseiflexaceae bacterium]|nr:NAD(P)H-binding protein [Roseiflexaceae bacterium]